MESIQLRWDSIWASKALIWVSYMGREGDKLARELSV
jgi:hypothetical protein